MVEDKFDLLKRNTLGSRMKLKRKGLGISTDDMANKLHIGLRTLYKYENDGSLPDVYQLFTLAELFNVTFKWMLYGDKK